MASDTAQSGIKQLRNWCILFFAAWSLVLLGSFTFFVKSEWEIVNKLGLELGRAILHKDITARAWNSRSGGIYVPPSEAIPPNPYLKDHPNRDVTTSSGIDLTLINPAYMTRLLHELGRDLYDSKAHITSLNPINPTNSPDAWERKALRLFEQGEVELQEFVTLDGAPFMRLMLPLRTEGSCLQCHARHGYKIGDIRGGLSTTIAMRDVYANVEDNVLQSSLLHLVVYTLGVFGLILFFIQRSRHLAMKETSRRELRQQKEMLREIVDNASSGIAVYRQDEAGSDFIIEEMNPAALKAVRLEREDTIGRKLTETFPGAKKMGIFDVFQEVYRSGQPKQMDVADYDDNRINLWVENYIFRLSTGEVIAVFNDRTEIKKAEETEQEKRWLYKFLFEDNQSPMLLIDPETSGILGANTTASQFYGYAREEFGNMRLGDISATSSAILMEMLELIEDRETTHFTAIHRKADGSSCDVEIYAGPIPFGGRTMICATIHDISRRLKNEREKEQLITDLTNALAEIKTLRGILPICSHCKKIRNDEGSWDMLESYIHNHTDVQFSHGICPDCVRKHHPEIASKILKDT